MQNVPKRKICILMKNFAKYIHTQIYANRIHLQRSTTTLGFLEGFRFLFGFFVRIVSLNHSGSFDMHIEKSSKKTFFRCLQKNQVLPYLGGRSESCGYVCNYQFFISIQRINSRLTSFFLRLCPVVKKVSQLRSDKYKYWLDIIPNYSAKKGEKAVHFPL